MDAPELLIADLTVRLEKMPGKGGWTFAQIEVPVMTKKGQFNWKKVRGFIDDYEINGSYLMPMKNGKLFLPVKAEIRKKISKEVGDWIRVQLYNLDTAPPVNDDDFMVCLEEEPEALKIFKSFSEEAQRKYLEWISAGGTDEQKVERMATAISRILEGRQMWKL